MNKIGVISIVLLLAGCNAADLSFLVGQEYGSKGGILHYGDDVVAVALNWSVGGASIKTESLLSGKTCQGEAQIVQNGKNIKFSSSACGLNEMSGYLKRASHAGATQYDWNIVLPYGRLYGYSLGRGRDDDLQSDVKKRKDILQQAIPLQGNYGGISWKKQLDAPVFGVYLTVNQYGLISVSLPYASSADKVACEGRYRIKDYHRTSKNMTFECIYEVKNQSKAFIGERFIIKPSGSDLVLETGSRTIQLHKYDNQAAAHGAMKTEYDKKLAEKQAYDKTERVAQAQREWERIKREQEAAEARRREAERQAAIKRSYGPGGGVRELRQTSSNVRTHLGLFSPDRKYIVAHYYVSCHNKGYGSVNVDDRSFCAVPQRGLRTDIKCQANWGVENAARYLCQ